MLECPKFDCCKTGGSVTQSLDQLVEDSNNIGLIELFKGEWDRGAGTTVNGYKETRMLADSLPAADEPNRSFEVFKSTTTDFTCNVVADPATPPRFMYKYHSTGLAYRAGDGRDRERIDTSNID